MATYQQIKKGSKGDSVSELQKLLNQNGYSLDADGIFGEKTQAAVRDYQSKNGLAVDGIVGSNTWSSLTGGANKQAQQNISGQAGQSTADWLAAYEKPIPTYTPSQAVQDAADRLAQYEQNKPGEYQSTYADQIQELLNQALNPQKFSYDPNIDPLYKQAAERYQQQGQLAMRDTMGQAAALSGGFGNSYAQTVGQQAYQGYLQGMNDMLPEFQEAAYRKYLNDQNNTLTQMQLLQGMDQADYSRYRDDMSDYYNDLNYALNQYNQASSEDYDRYMDAANAMINQRDYFFNKQQAEQAQQNWQTEFDYAAQAAASSGRSGGGSSSGSNTYQQLLKKAKNYELTMDEIGEAYEAGKITEQQTNRLMEMAEENEELYGSEDADPWPVFDAALRLGGFVTGLRR